MTERDDRSQPGSRPPKRDQAGAEQDQGKKRHVEAGKRRRPRLAYAFTLLGLIGVIGVGAVYLLVGGGGGSAPAHPIPTIPPDITATRPAPPPTASFPTPRSPTLKVYETFATPSERWITALDPEEGSLLFIHGVYQFEVDRPETWLVSAYSNLSAQGVGWVQLQVLSEVNSDSSYGMICRLQKNGDGYFFDLTSDNRYRILRIENGVEMVLAEGEYLYNPSDPHELAIKCQDSLLGITLDRGEWIEVVDEAFTDGAVALFARSGDQDDLSIAFDEFTFYSLP